MTFLCCIFCPAHLFINCVLRILSCLFCVVHFVLQNLFSYFHDNMYTGSVEHHIRALASIRTDLSLTALKKLLLIVPKYIFC